jgi:hypothetical protein
MTPSRPRSLPFWYRSGPGGLISQSDSRTDGSPPQPARMQWATPGHRPRIVVTRLQR